GEEGRRQLLQPGAMPLHEFDHFTFVPTLVHRGGKNCGGIVVGVNYGVLIPKVPDFDIEPASTQVLGHTLGDTPCLTLSCRIQYSNWFLHLDVLCDTSDMNSRFPAKLSVQ